MINENAAALWPATEEHAIIAATYTIPITALQETAEKEAAEAKEYQKNILKVKF